MIKLNNSHIFVNFQVGNNLMELYIYQQTKIYLKIRIITTVSIIDNSKQNIFITKINCKTFPVKDKMLYFGDPELVEKHLHEDLNTIIKNVKIRQEQHLELLQYNKSIAIKKRSIENTLFINDQITTHNQFLSKVIQLHQKVNSEEDQILQKYHQAAVKFQPVIKLMARVVTRIIETNQTFIDKIKSYDQAYMEQFSKMKSSLTKLINSKDQIDLSQCTKIIINYTKHKAIHQIQKLKLLIKSLQDGQIQKVPFIYKGIKPSETPKVQPAKVEKPPEKKASPVKKEQKHDIVNKIKNQIKLQQNAKKHKKNLANKLANMYSTMDLSKKEFVQDIVSTNKRDYDRIYGQILTRNKFNQGQILQFQNKKQEFEQKVKFFKEMMLEQSKKIQQVLMIKKPVKIQRQNDTQSGSASKLDIEPLETQEKNPESMFDDSSPTKEFKRAFILRQKANSPKFHKQTEYTQLRITQDGFNHIKFDSSNQEIFLRSNRNRLPSIQNKQQQSVSVDNQNRYHLGKSKEEKEKVRKNFLMKNIELGVQNVIKQNQNKSESKNIAQKIRQIQPSNPSINNINLLEFTFYGSKKKSFALGQTKNNFVF